MNFSDNINVTNITDNTNMIDVSSTWTSTDNPNSTNVTNFTDNVSAFDVFSAWHAMMRYSRYNNGTIPRNRLGYSMQYFVYRAGKCINVKNDPTAFLDLMAILQICLCVLGLLGAVTSVTVTSSRGLRSSTSVYLTALGIYDGLFTMVAMTAASLRLTESRVSWLTGVCNCLWTFCTFTSAYVIICVTAERSLSVAKPYFMEKYRSTKMAIKLNVGILIVGVLVNFPHIIDEILHLSTDGSCTSGENKVIITPFGRIYTVFISIPINFVIPFFVVLIMNVWFACTLILLRKARRKQFVVFPSNAHNGPAPSQGHTDEGLIRLIIALSCWYSLCWLLPGFYYVYKLPRADIFDLSDEIKIAACVDTLIIANAAINSIFYFLLWRQFRLACITTWRARMCVLRHRDVSVMRNTSSDVPMETVCTNVISASPIKPAQELRRYKNT